MLAFARIWTCSLMAANAPLPTITPAPSDAEAGGQLLCRPAKTGSKYADPEAWGITGEFSVWHMIRAVAK